MNVSPEWRFPSVTALARALWPFGSERGRMVWQEAFGSSEGAARPAPRGAPSNETVVAAAARTPRWQGREQPVARPAEVAPAPPPSEARAPSTWSRFAIGIALATL